MSDQGTISRTNVGAVLEAWLGKLAAHTGKPVNVPDFKNISDMRGWVDEQLRRAGLSSMEDVTLPKYGRKVNVGTGTGFFMKLHHQSEGKAQARSGGGYTSEDAPSKGGETGCFLGETLVSTEHGPKRIMDLVRDRTACKVWTLNKKGEPCLEDVTDWFEWELHGEFLDKVTLDDGTVLHVSWDHDFLRAGGELRHSLAVGDELEGLE